MMYGAVSVVRSSLWDMVAAEIQEGVALQKIIQGLMQGSEEFLGYSLNKGRLFYQGGVVLPSKSSQIPILLAEFCDTATRGHSGFLCTYKKLAGAFYWKGMRKALKDFVAAVKCASRINMRRCPLVGYWNL